MFHVPNSTRREFLGGLGLLGLAAATPNFLIRTALAQAPPTDNILVVVQQSGGNDGLSMVVPYGHDDYHRVRQASRIGANEVLKLDDHVGLHPNLRGLKDLHDQGQLTVVQGVGYPNFNQSHFTSMDIWHAADPNIQDRGGQPQVGGGLTGWLGRYCDHAYRGNVDIKRSVAVGFTQAPRAIQGRQHPGLSFQGAGGFRLFAGNRGGNQMQNNVSNKLARIAPAANNNEDLDFVNQTIANAIATGEQISNLALRYQTPIQYPFNIPLAVSLRTVAAMISSGLSTRVFYVFQDGYDTHADQRTRHDKLMADLNAAIVAFQKDIARQGNTRRVLMMTMSEFGRRVHENGSRGTDHGMAAPLFLIGPAVKGGIHGQHPGLTRDELVLNRDLQFHTDFRSVYATVLEKWLGTQSRPILGRQMPLLSCL